MTSQYRRGADLERKAKQTLEANGALYVVRAAGSHGPADLIAFWGRPGAYRTEFIQVKRSGKLSKADRMALCALAVTCGAVPVLASQGPRGIPVVFEAVEMMVA